ncbi:aldehyde dehydrogenase family protein [Halocatena pleomorpha]|uniref:Aldehyde dehydrogenase family protein n=1 Tax=Halocatena pleomorpha TaxID=1785090 RepID=A0A3P3RAW2_9EURY|nr:aldehyde dehydrogenase family protein [Halocatena pleomorpha]RRJ30068.1 aldehyde dehydrogenase family protein [Halocatena pleomorpha]
MSGTTESTPAIGVDAEWNRLFLDGEREPDGRDSLAVENPATREQIAAVPKGTPQDIDDAYDVAATAQSEWATQTPAKRAAVLSRAVSVLRDQEDEILELLTVEAGSSRLKGRNEIRAASAITQQAAGFPTRVSGDHRESNIAGKEHLVKREPVGVVGVISPWNYPLHLSIRAVAPALAVGNGVVLKPSSETPITGGLLIARIFEAAGLPDGLLNVVPGRGSEIGDPMAGHPDAGVIAFTGSTTVGRQVAKQAVDHLAYPAMELGGNGPHVVLESADVETAVDAGVFGSFLHQGQLCISINRHLVHESLYGDYVEQFTTRAEALPVGDPAVEETVIGPVINESQREQMLNYVEQTVDAGATLETGGAAVSNAAIEETTPAGQLSADHSLGDSNGLFVLPTVLSDATNAMSAACNEHFGPIAPVIPFDSEDTAIELANDTDYGLAASVCGSVNRAERVASEIDAGMVHVNDQPINDEPHVPFGGYKGSGIGRFNGEYVREEFTQPKWISIQHESREYPF